MPLLSNFVAKFFRGNRVPPTPVPVAGAEIIVNGTMEADANWANDTSPTTNERSSAQARSGTYSRRVVAVDGARGFQQSLGTLPNGWLRYTASAYTASGVTCFTNIIGNDGVENVAALTIGSAGAWRDSIITNRCATSGASSVVRFRSATGASEFFVDNVSVVPLTLASLISVHPYASADIDLYAGVARLAGTQAGFALRVDDPDNPQNFILVYETGAGRVKADKVISGVYTNILDAAITYGAGVGLRAVANGTSVSVYYNGVQVGSTATVADASIRYNTNHGLFSTHEGNTFAGYTAMMAL